MEGHRVGISMLPVAGRPNMTNFACGMGSNSGYCQEGKHGASDWFTAQFHRVCSSGSGNDKNWEYLSIPTHI
jgi:hypothetical protein